MAVTAVTPTSFGAKVRAARRAKEITQIQLGRMIGCSGTHICALEKRYKEPTLEERRRLIKALNLPKESVA